MTDAIGLQPGDLLTVPQALQILPIGKSTLYRLINDGRIPHVRIRGVGARRGRVLLDRRDLEAFVEKSRHGATRAPARLDVDGIHARVRRRMGHTGGIGGSAAEP